MPTCRDACLLRQHQQFVSVCVLQLRVAGVQLLYNSDLVGAALGFVNELQHHSSRVLERTADAADEHGQPRNLTERVLHSFARHDIPVDRPVSLPLISVDMYCPGTSHSAICLHVTLVDLKTSLACTAGLYNCAQF